MVEVKTVYPTHIYPCQGGCGKLVQRIHEDDAVLCLACQERLLLEIVEGS